MKRRRPRATENDRDFGGFRRTGGARGSVWVVLSVGGLK